MHFDHYRLMSDDELVASLFGLAVECPLDCPEEVCSIAPLRRLPLRRRLKAILALSRAEQERLMAQHIEHLERAEARRAARGWDGQEPL